MGYHEEGKLIIEPLGSTDFVEKIIKIDGICPLPRTISSSSALTTPV
jgi:hypothetical protein